MSILSEKMSVGIAGNMYSSAGHEMLMDINGTPLSSSDDKEFRPEVQQNKYCVEVSHKEEYTLYTYLANPVTVHSYGASRPGSLWVALTVPAGFSIVDSNPFDLLMEILDVFRRNYMSLRADGSYEFKEINCASRPIRDILEKYTLSPVRRSFIMSGTTIGFVKTETEDKMKEFLKDTRYGEFRDYSSVIVAENINGNYMNITIPCQRTYSIWADEVRLGDIDASGGDFKYVFKKEYCFELEVKFSVSDLQSSKGKIEGSTDKGYFSVVMDDIAERIYITVCNNEITYSHDVQIPDDLRGDGFEVSLGEKKKQIGFDSGVLKVDLIGKEEADSASLKFKHRDFELNSRLDENGVYQVTKLQRRFQGTKCKIFGERDDKIRINDKLYQFDALNKIFEIPGINADCINEILSGDAPKTITYKKNQRLDDEDGWNVLGFTQEIKEDQKPCLVNKDNNLNDANSHIVNKQTTEGRQSEKPRNISKKWVQVLIVLLLVFFAFMAGYCIASNKNECVLLKERFFIPMMDNLSESENLLKNNSVSAMDKAIQLCYSTDSLYNLVRKEYDENTELSKKQKNYLKKILNNESLCAKSDTLKSNIRSSFEEKVRLYSGLMDSLYVINERKDTVELTFAEVENINKWVEDVKAADTLTSLCKESDIMDDYDFIIDNIQYFNRAVSEIENITEKTYNKMSFDEYTNTNTKNILRTVSEEAKGDRLRSFRFAIQNISINRNNTKIINSLVLFVSEDYDWENIDSFFDLKVVSDEKVN